LPSRPAEQGSIDDTANGVCFRRHAAASHANNLTKAAASSNKQNKQTTAAAAAAESERLLADHSFRTFPLSALCGKNRTKMRFGIE